MTVSNATNRVTFAGDDVTTSFDTTPIKFFATSDLLVYVTTDATGATELLTEGTEYTVSGGDESVGAVGAVSLAGGSAPHGALASGTTLVIIREVALTQEADFVQNDASSAEVAEAALDKITMALQRFEDKLARSMVISDGDVSGADFTVPTPSASKLIGWNGDADALILYAAASIVDTIVPTAFMETLLDDADAEEARGTLDAVGIAADETITGDKTFSGATVFTTAPSGLGVPLVKRKPADESIDTSTTLQNDDDLVFAVGANEEWGGSIDLYVASPALGTVGFKVGLTIPAGAALEAVGSIVAEGSEGFCLAGPIAVGTPLAYTPSGVSEQALVHIHLWVLNGATPGNIQVQWAQNVSDGTTLQVIRGSKLVAHRIA
jgi:hypothetical protein